MRGLETNSSRYFILVEFHGLCWVDPRRPRADAVGESVCLDKRAFVNAKTYLKPSLRTAFWKSISDINFGAVQQKRKNYKIWKLLHNT
jgi:hypothetical protein